MFKGFSMAMLNNQMVILKILKTDFTLVLLFFGWLVVSPIFFVGCTPHISNVGCALLFPCRRCWCWRQAFGGRQVGVHPRVLWLDPWVYPAAKAGRAFFVLVLWHQLYTYTTCIYIYTHIYIYNILLLLYIYVLYAKKIFKKKQQTHRAYALPLEEGPCRYVQILASK